MCGIAGWLSWEEPVDVPVLDAMTRQLAHRGPDAHGVKIIGPAGLGHRRLSIIDTSETNNQPLSDSTGRFWIAFNGEIYNFQEIRSGLESLGVVFRTRGDTEVILEAYKHYEVDCVQHLNGMFAFALWDDVKSRLFIARDRLGEKPLFYYVLPNGLLFGSEPSALLAHPSVAREVDPRALAQFLALNYTSGEQYLVTGIKSLRPAHFLVAERERPVVISRYWDLAQSFHRKRRFKDELEAADELSGLLNDAVKMRMISDVPLGTFLSGGIDSSTVVSCMAGIVPADMVKTFCIGFNEKSFDESAQARLVSEHFGTDHRERIVSESKDRIVRALEWAAREPLADSSFLPTYSLAEFTREHVTVALSGDGGDECFTGYETYAADALHTSLSWLPSGLVDAMYHAADELVPVSMSKVSFDYRLRHFLKGLRHPLSMAHNMWRMILDEPARLNLLNPDFHHCASDDVVFSDMVTAWHSLEGCHFLDRAMYVDVESWLPDDILTKVDRATMAHSLESRAPFLDHRILEFAAQLPVSWRMKGLKKKYLLKLSQRDRLPKKILAQKKQGFSSPVSIWLSGMLKDYRDDVLADESLNAWFRRSELNLLVQDHDRGRRDNGLKLFGLMLFALWNRNLREQKLDYSGHAYPSAQETIASPATAPGWSGVAAG